MSPMRVAARRTLALQPDVLLRASSGEIATLSSKPLQATYLHVYSPTLEPLWSAEVPSNAIGAFTQDDLFWVVDRTGASAYSLSGQCTHRTDFSPPQGMRVGGAAPVARGFIVALEHDADHPVTAPIVMHVRPTGEVEWSQALPMENVVLRGERRLAEGRRVPWREPVETWHCSYFTAGQVVVGTDAILVVFSDMPRSGIGMGYALSAHDGTFRFATRMGPIHHVASLNDGEFLVGYQGYGAFETYHYGRDGAVLDRWNSTGHFVVDGSDIRVVELRNDSGAMRITRLRAGGAISRGARLDGFYTSRPCLAADGLLRFFRAGLVYAVRDLAIADLLAVYTMDDEVFATEMVAGVDCVYVCFTRLLPSEVPGHVEIDSHLIRVDI